VDTGTWSRALTSDRDAARVALPERLWQLYSEGATLILNHTQKSIPSIGRLVRRLKQELEFETGVNIYITHPTRRALQSIAIP